MCVYYFFKNNLNKIVIWVQKNQATNHVQHMPVGHQVSCEEPEALGSEVSRKEEEVQREGAPRAWVPPHRTGGTPDGQASLDFLGLCSPLGLWLMSSQSSQRLRCPSHDLFATQMTHKWLRDLLI